MCFSDFDKILQLYRRKERNVPAEYVAFIRMNVQNRCNC